MAPTRPDNAPWVFPFGPSPDRGVGLPFRSGSVLARAAALPAVSADAGTVLLHILKRSRHPFANPAAAAAFPAAPRAAARRAVGLLPLVHRVSGAAGIAAGRGLLDQKRRLRTMAGIQTRWAARQRRPNVTGYTQESDAGRAAGPGQRAGYAL